MEYQVIIPEKEFQRLKTFEKLHENNHVVIDYRHYLTPDITEHYSKTYTVEERIKELAEQNNKLFEQKKQLQDELYKLKREIGKATTRREFKAIQKTIPHFLRY
jgi:predicted nuclease with TOPRIM domain